MAQHKYLSQNNNEQQSYRNGYHFQHNSPHDTHEQSHLAWGGLPVPFAEDRHHSRDQQRPSIAPPPPASSQPSSAPPNKPSLKLRIKFRNKNQQSNDVSPKTSSEAHQRLERIAEDCRKEGEAIAPLPAEYDTLQSAAQPSPAEHHQHAADADLWADGIAPSSSRHVSGNEQLLHLHEQPSGPQPQRHDQLYLHQPHSETCPTTSTEDDRPAHSNKRQRSISPDPQCPGLLSTDLNRQPYSKHARHHSSSSPRHPVLPSQDMDRQPSGKPAQRPSHSERHASELPARIECTDPERQPSDRHARHPSQPHHRTPEPNKASRSSDLLQSGADIPEHRAAKRQRAGTHDDTPPPVKQQDRGRGVEVCTTHKQEDRGSIAGTPPPVKLQDRVSVPHHSDKRTSHGQHADRREAVSRTQSLHRLPSSELPGASPNHTDPPRHRGQASEAAIDAHTRSRQRSAPPVASRQQHESGADHSKAEGSAGLKPEMRDVSTQATAPSPPPPPPPPLPPASPVAPPPLPEEDPWANLLDLLGELAQDDIGRGKTHEQYHAAARKYKRQGDDIRGIPQPGRMHEQEALVTYAKAGVSFMRQGYTLENMLAEHRAKRSNVVTLYESTASWLNQTLVNVGKSDALVQRLARILMERMSAVAQLRAQWLNRTVLLEECKQVEAGPSRRPSPLGSQPSSPTMAGTPLTHAQQNNRAPNAQHQQQHQHQYQQSGYQHQSVRGGAARGRGSRNTTPGPALDRYQGQKAGAKPPMGGPASAANSPGSNTSTNSATSAHGLGAAGGSAGNNPRANGHGAAAAYANELPPVPMQLATSLRRTLRASETLKTTSSEIMLLIGQLAPGHGKSAAGALALMAMDGAGGELRTAVACAGRALHAICELHAASRAGS